MAEKLKLGVIYGSARPGRFCDTVASWALKEIAKSQEFESFVMDPAQLLASHQIEPKSEKLMEEFQNKIKDADCYLIVVPEYNHGYPAPLKYLIDAEYEGWRAKPVSFVSYGGISGGIRAVEQLRQVFCEMHAVSIRDAVHLTNARHLFDANGQLINPGPTEKAMMATLRQLKWWGKALRTARLANAYEF